MTETQTDTVNLNEQDINIENRRIAYSHALDLLKYEGQMLWTILSTCMVVNVLLVGFIAGVVGGNGYIYAAGSVPCVVGSFAGLLISVAWYGTFLRNTKYYLLRMAQAKQYEDKDFPLLNKKAKQFSKGHKVKINGKQHQLVYLSLWMENRLAGHIMILVFFAIYILVICNCWPINWRWCLG